MGMSSLVHVRFARATPSVSPRHAENAMYASASAKTSGSAAVTGRINAMQASGTSAGRAVSASCTLSFARSTCQGLTGSDCASQRDFPSSETDGVAMSFIDAMAHTPVQSSTSAQPLCEVKTSFSSDTTVPPFHKSRMPEIGSSRIPRPLLSM